MPNDFEFELAGNKYRIADLSHPVNDDFLSYHQSVFGLPAFNVNQFKENSKCYFSSVKNDMDRWKKHDSYFGNFTIGYCVDRTGRGDPGAIDTIPYAEYDFLFNIILIIYIIHLIA